MIKAVLFDYGGVLSEGGTAGSLAQLYGKLYGLKAEEVQGLSLRLDWLRGKLNDEAFFSGLNSLHSDKPTATAALFLEYSSAIFNRSGIVHQLAASLRQAGLRTGILSDVVPVAAEEHTRRGDYKDFDPVLLSCVEGIIKPDVKLYERALAKLRLPAREVLFIDDKEINLVPARVLGMHTILAKSPNQIVNDTSKLVKAENNLELFV